MKLTVSLKDPGALDDAIDEAMREVNPAGLSEDKAETVREVCRAAVREVCRKWFEYGEYLRVEVDTDAKTCTVLPAK